MSVFLVKIFSSLKRRGVRRTLVRISGRLLLEAGIARLINRTLAKLFDARHGTQTCGIVFPEQMDIDPERKAHGQFYVATPFYEFKRLMARLDVDTTKYTFIDFGCGMGKVLLYADAYNFQSVIGIEYSTLLADIARKNIALYCGDKTPPPQVIIGDAGTFKIPPTPCVLFFFNPFSSTVTGEVLVNLHQAYQDGNQDIYIVWYNTTDNAAPLFEAPWLQVIDGETTCVIDDFDRPLLQLAQIWLPYTLFRVRPES